MPGGEPKHASQVSMDREGARITAELAGIDDGTDPFASAVRATRMPMVITNPREHDNPIVFANDAFCRLTGYSREEILGRNCRFMQGRDTDPAAVDRIRDAIAVQEPIELDVRNHRNDGTSFWNRLLIAPINDPNGKVAYFFASQFDVSAEIDGLEARTRELAQARVELQSAAAEREQVEEAFRQSRKMEAVGQLTGGIAHDFNNMLQAINSSLELMSRRIEQGRPQEASRFVSSARKTVERAAALTNRLLAFARRQALQPKPVVLDILVEEMAELLKRTVGAGIQVELKLGDGAWTVLCDPSQLENALLNLVINARDAMPAGGVLTIATQDVFLEDIDVAGQEGATAGEYVEVSVADTGVGMDDVTRDLAFDPFFTTKPLGQGTGLGLSQLYGFVRQSNGVVSLDSAPGRGTTVRIRLPRYDMVQPADELEALEAELKEIGQGEVVLLVEDEEIVRAMAAEQLRDLGYTVVEAKDGPAAMRLLLSEPRIDALVTDVGLPGGLNGRQVAEAARENRPMLPVLFITGFAGSVLKEQLAPGMQVIGKPFALETLALRVQAMMEPDAAS
jgi:PAS domain S-box-containing protein